MNTPTKAQSSSLAAWTLGSSLLLFFIFVFLFAPPSLPEFKQRMLGLLGAMLAGSFAFFLTGKMGLELLSAKSRFGQVAVKATGGLAVFVLVLWWWFSSGAPVTVEKVLQKATEIERYTKGGNYPSISVELYFGPQTGMRHTFTTVPQNPGFLAVSVENTNDFPIYDLELGMIDTTEDRNPETMQKFNREFSRKLTDMRILHPNKCLVDLLPANPNSQSLAFTFYAKTRAGDTAQRFSFVVVSNQWESAWSIVETRASNLLGSAVSANYPRNSGGEPIW